MKLGIVVEMLLVPILLAGGRSQLATALDPSGNSQFLGVLVGSVTRGPLSPVARLGGPPASVAVASARIDIATAEGNPLTSVVTDSRGNFKIKLPPGKYHLTMPSLHGAMFTKDLPATLTIGPGEVKRVDIHLDTGIR
jgi:hypothetical protein